ncbi:hypothetical protein N7492_005233 [Penicillium capsulatum]|uniref:Cytochrome b-c1 complex subunit 10 n=1 Tax=Penicillium capsulatum TaxID=69766 RepID=A0A9W9IBW6_9EURO|nr:hypothetical protein N7492_005233 [Penicillium capsulatum]KAJ6135662.1 hypothetical protein N7512_000822 [Penicillium capsulatum]
MIGCFVRALPVFVDHRRQLLSLSRAIVPRPALVDNNGTSTDTLRIVSFLCAFIWGSLSWPDPAGGRLNPHHRSSPRVARRQRKHHDNQEEINANGISVRAIGLHSHPPPRRGFHCLRPQVRTPRTHVVPTFPFPTLRRSEVERIEFHMAWVHGRAALFVQPRTIGGFTVASATQIGTLAGSFGVFAGAAALFFLGEVPRVRRDVLQQFPFLDTYFDRTIAPEDNPF